MNLTGTAALKNRGSSLIETVIAMGTLAIAIPLVFGAIAESGKSSMSSEAETRSTWIIPTCMEEIQASRNGTAEYFTTTRPGDAFPPGGTIWALAFTAEGRAVDKVSKSAYDKALKELDGEPVRYIATLSAEPPTGTPDPGVSTMLRAKITLEYPAGAPFAKRQKIDFFTRIP